MEITKIDTLQAFDQLKVNWDDVYDADPYAHFFVSRVWLRAFFQIMQGRWFVLALRPNSNSPYVAFLPLTLEKYRFNLANILRIGGAPIADYTGFVCLPGYEHQAIETFAVYLQKYVRWDKFHLKDVLDPRLDLFISSFSEKAFNIQHVERIPCPYITLPESWDQYLMESLSRNWRKNLTRSMRRVESLEGFSVTFIQPDNFDTQVETLLSLWQAKWQMDPYGYRNIFRHCFENDCLWLTILWQADTPMAALAGFLDRSKKSFYSFISGYNDQYAKAKFSPGQAIRAYSIRYAIENGYKIFDFLRGDEEYKFSYGAVERFNSYTLITPKTLRSIIVNNSINFIKKYKKS